MAGPLTAEDRKLIDEQLAQLKTAKEEIKRAKLAGIDVSEYETQADALEKQLQMIKSAYFPSGK